MSTESCNAAYSISLSHDAGQGEVALWELIHSGFDSVHIAPY
jgi:hypothetical protein